MPAPLSEATSSSSTTADKVDVAVVGAGFAGLYLCEPPAPKRCATSWPRPSRKRSKTPGRAIRPR